MESEIYERFCRLAGAKGDALLFSGSFPHSWRQVLAEVNDLAARFASEKIPLVLAGKNSPQKIIAFIAARRAGRMILLADELREEQAIHSLCALLGLFRFYHCADGSLGQVFGDGAVPELPDNAAFCQLTSGSTGTPKLILRTEQSLIDEGGRYALRYGINENDVILAALPLSHAFIFGLAVGCVVRTGCGLNLLPEPNPLRIAEVLDRGYATVLPLVPSVARLVCRTFEVKGKKLHGAALRHIIVGAGPLRRELRETIVDRLGIVPVRNYGCSEMGTLLGSLPNEPDNEATGKPFDGVEVFIRSVSGGQGMFFVWTQCPFVGYLTGDGVDTGKISPDGWYCTGDIAEAHQDGSITIHRRIGEAIRRGGRFIHPYEVRRVIELHPDVQDAVISAENGDDGEPLVKAWVQTHPGSSLDANAIRAYLMSHLDEYKIPTQWNISDSIPRTASGKPAVIGAAVPSFEFANILKMITSYRGAAALLWADEAGLLETLNVRGDDAGVVSAERCEMQRGKEMLASVILSYGVMNHNDDGVACRWPESASPFLRDLWAFERAFLGVLLGGTRNPLKGTGAARPLENPDIGSLYERLMAYPGRNAAFQAARSRWLKAGPVLEIGNPTSILAPLLNRMGEGCCKAVSMPQFAREARQSDSYGAIYLFNAIRRLAADEGMAGFETISRLLMPGGYLVVADIFMDVSGAYSRFKPFFQVDWLLQGEWSCASSDELVRLCGRAGMVHVETRDIDGLYSLIVFKSYR